MASHNYSISVLLLLDLGKGLTVYDLSKLLGRFDTRVSNGTIIPLMNRLMELEYVKFTKSGRRKIYRLTARGKKYVASVKKIREGIKRNALTTILGTNAVYLDLLANVDDISTLEQVLERIGGGMMKLLGTAFRLEKEGNTKKLAELDSSLRKLLEAYR